MNHTVPYVAGGASPSRQPIWLRFGKLSEMLELLSALRGIEQPLTAPEGLRQSLELLLRLAQFAGVDPRWTARLRMLLDDRELFELALAIVRYLARVMDSYVGSAVTPGDKPDTPSPAQPSIAAAAANPPAPPVTVDGQSFVDWLPIVLQILSLLRQLRRPL